MRLIKLIIGTSKTVLKVNGCLVEMGRLPTMAHASVINGVPKLRRAQNDALLGWMKTYVK